MLIQAALKVRERDGAHHVARLVKQVVDPAIDLLHAEQDHRAVRPAGFLMHLAAVVGRIRPGLFDLWRLGVRTVQMPDMVLAIDHQRLGGADMIVRHASRAGRELHQHIDRPRGVVDIQNVIPKILEPGEQRPVYFAVVKLVSVGHVTSPNYVGRPCYANDPANDAATDETEPFSTSHRYPFATHSNVES